MVCDNLILSASGWRGVFAADGGEESRREEISDDHRLFFRAAAFVFAEYINKLKNQLNNRPLILVGCDTRPTGNAIANAVIPILLSCGCKVRYAGICAAPEIMAWARGSDDAAGFIFVSASHNPIGHNGLKFGLTDGGVLSAQTAEKLAQSLRSFLAGDESPKKIKSVLSALNILHLNEVYACSAGAKTGALKAYYDFCGEVIWGGNGEIADAVKTSLAKKPLGIVCDFNGSARTVSIDKDFFLSLGLRFDCINDKPGQIVHRIVPEGESLEPCRALLEKAHESDSSFVLGYTPDCDGDRGNLVIWDDKAGTARALEAQEVFALACVAELSHLVWTGALVYDGKKCVTKSAVVVNGATSLRIDRIAEAFGVSVFRAETGEANVVALARKLREEGYIVRILGEGSAGGNITHPSAVRDPINTVLAIVKLLSARSSKGKIGLFEIWLKQSKQIEKYNDDFTLYDCLASLPQFATTPAYSKDAVLKISAKDHSLLKDRYQKIFMREWEARKDELKARFGFSGWQARAYNGLEETRGLSGFGFAAKGGLKISFFDDNGKETAFIWMRASATEPVFRVMADGTDTQIERYLLEWQSSMIMEADKIRS